MPLNLKICKVQNGKSESNSPRGIKLMPLNVKICKVQHFPFSTIQFLRFRSIYRFLRFRAIMEKYFSISLLFQLFQYVGYHCMLAHGIVYGLLAILWKIQPCCIHIRPVKKSCDLTYNNSRLIEIGELENSKNILPILPQSWYRRSGESWGDHCVNVMIHC